LEGREPLSGAFHLSPELRCVFPQQSFSDDDGFCFSDQPERIARYRYDTGNGTKPIAAIAPIWMRPTRVDSPSSRFQSSSALRVLRSTEREQRELAAAAHGYAELRRNQGAAFAPVLVL